MEKLSFLYGPAHEILTLIAYAQKPPLNAYADASGRARSIIVV